MKECTKNPHLKEPARVLRKNMTDAETKLWSVIRRKQIGGMQFYRQKVIGDYIVEFFCHAANLVIEVDGGQHYSIEGKASDQNRDAYLKELGLQVLRFSNIDVLQETEAVVKMIWETVYPSKSPFEERGTLRFSVCGGAFSPFLKGS